MRAGLTLGNHLHALGATVDIIAKVDDMGWCCGKLKCAKTLDVVVQLPKQIVAPV